MDAYRAAAVGISSTSYSYIPPESIPAVLGYCVTAAHTVWAINKYNRTQQQTADSILYIRLLLMLLCTGLFFQRRWLTA